MTQIYSFTVIGTNFADVLTTEIATALEPTLVRGLGGDDTIIGYGPLDRLEGGLGSDNISSRGGIVVGGLGSDTITVMADAAVAVYDGAGNDIVSITGNGTSAVRIYADNSDPSGNDFFRVQNAPGAVISYQAATQSITLFMNAQASGADIGTDQVFGFGAAIGGSGNDVMHAAISGSKAM